MKLLTIILDIKQILEMADPPPANAGFPPEQGGEGVIIITNSTAEGGNFSNTFMTHEMAKKFWTR